MTSRYALAFFSLVFAQCLIYSPSLSASWINGTLSLNDHRKEKVSVSQREMQESCEHAIEQVEAAYQDVGRELELRCMIYEENFWGDIDYMVYMEWSSTEMPIQCAREHELRYAEISIDDRLLVNRYTYDWWRLGDQAVWKRGFFATLHTLGKSKGLDLTLRFSNHIVDSFFDRLLKQLDVKPEPVGFRVPYCV